MLSPAGSSSVSASRAIAIKPRTCLASARSRFLVALYLPSEDEQPIIGVTTESQNPIG